VGFDGKGAHRDWAAVISQPCIVDVTLTEHASVCSEAAAAAAATAAAVAAAAMT
jgi:hypothetical protein